MSMTCDEQMCVLIFSHTQSTLLLWVWRIICGEQKIHFVSSKKSKKNAKSVRQYLVFEHSHLWHCVGVCVCVRVLSHAHRRRCSACAELQRIVNRTMSHRLRALSRLLLRCFAILFWHMKLSSPGSKWFVCMLQHTATEAIRSNVYRSTRGDRAKTCKTFYVFQISRHSLPDHVPAVITYARVLCDLTGQLGQAWFIWTYTITDARIQHARNDTK